MHEKKVHLVKRDSIVLSVLVYSANLTKYACYGANMLVPGRLLAMIRSETAIFDLTDRFYGMKNVISELSNRL